MSITIRHVTYSVRGEVSAMGAPPIFFLKPEFFTEPPDYFALIDIICIRKEVLI